MICLKPLITRRSRVRIPPPLFKKAPEIRVFVGPHRADLVRGTKRVPRSARVFAPVARPSGFVFRLEKARGPSWWAKYRLPDGRQVKRKIGPAWTRRGRARGRPLHQALGGRLALRPARGASAGGGRCR